MITTNTKYPVWMVCFLFALGLSGPAYSVEGTIELGPVDMHFERVDPSLPTVADVNALTVYGLENRITTDNDGNNIPSAGDTSAINGQFVVTSFLDSLGRVIIGQPGDDWEVTATYTELQDEIGLNPIGDPTTVPFTSSRQGILTMYVDVGPTVRASAITGQGYSEGVMVAQFFVTTGGGVFRLADPYDGSRDAFLLKQSGLSGFFVPDVNGANYDSNLDADDNANQIPGERVPTDWPYASAPVSFPMSFFTENDGSMRFGTLPDESATCRMTGGNTTVYPVVGVDGNPTWSYQFDGPSDGERVTTGGQINAPSGRTPPAGHWTHTLHGGTDGVFTFHAGTSSAPAGTEISTVECADPGWCVQARCAPFKQLFWTGVGNFANQRFDYDFGGCPVTKGNKGTLHFVKVMIGDFGENNRPTREAALVDDNPESCDWSQKLKDAGYEETGPWNAADAVLLDSVADDKFGDKGGQVCDTCPDYYQIEIHCDTDPASEVIYSFAGYLGGGNYQIHPLTGQQCPVAEEMVPELFETAGSTSPGKGRGNNK